jgi:hypothetical protein
LRADIIHSSFGRATRSTTIAPAITQFATIRMRSVMNAIGRAGEDDVGLETAVAEVILLIDT